MAISMTTKDTTSQAICILKRIIALGLSGIYFISHQFYRYIGLYSLSADIMSHIYIYIYIYIVINLLLSSKICIKKIYLTSILNE